MEHPHDPIGGLECCERTRGDRSVSMAAIVFSRRTLLTPTLEKTMNATITVTPEITTLVNVLTVEPENQVKLVESLRANTDNVVSTLPGWISTRFVVSHDKRRVLIYSQWRDLALLSDELRAQLTAYVGGFRTIHDFLFARYAMVGVDLLRWDRAP
jgi:Antibiotic biosynthesis monooxygenase